MSPKAKTRLPLLELIILVVVALIGWATFQLYHLGRDVTADRDDLQKQFADAFKRQEAAGQQHDEAWRKYVLNMQDVFKMQDVLVMQNALKLQHEHFLIAAYIQTNMTELQTALQEVLASRGAVKSDRFKRRSQIVQKWIERRQDRAEAEGFVVASQELKDRIATTPSLLTNAPIPITKELGTLLNDIGRAYTNYLAEADYVLNNVGQPLVDEPLNKALDKAAQRAQELIGLAKQSRQSGKAIQAFVEARQPLEFATTPRKEQQTPPVLPSTTEDWTPPWRPVLYALWTALIGLSFFAVMALYRRLIVAPLRIKLSETSALALHQSKLEHFLEHFSRLAQELAHEIRNPLTAVNARLFTLKKTLSEGSAEHKDATVIQNEINRLNRIVGDFLKLGSPAEPKFVPMSSKAALKEVQDLLGPELEKQSIQLTLDGVVDAPFRADPQQLKQVLINLVQNAADSIGHDGKITLRSRIGTATLKGTPTNAVMLEVEDTGSGIPPELQDRLFDPFFSTKEKGTGLGLPIAARIIDKHQGTLEFESTVGTGTLFRVVLPIGHEE